MQLLEKAAKCIIPPVGDAGKRELKRLQAVKEKLLPVERAGNFQLIERITELESMCNSTTPKHKLQRLSPEIFAMKKGRFPAFAVFDVNGNGRCTIATDPFYYEMPGCCLKHYRWAGDAADPLRRQLCIGSAVIWVIVMAAIAWFNFGLPTMLSRCIIGSLLSAVGVPLVVLAVLWAWRNCDDGPDIYTATTTFNGVIPDAVKAKLKEHQHLFSEIFLVAEAQNWKVNKPIPIGDPLLVGHDGTGFYLIEKFETTTLEDYVASEFCEKQ